jgi:cytosol alanyl aminopeptidase
VPSRTDSDAMRQLRGRLLPFAAEAGEDAQLRTQARQLALEWLAGDRVKLGAAASGVLNVAAMNGDAALFDAFVAALRRPDIDAGSSEEIYRSLGRFRDPALLQKAFEFALSDAVDLRESDDVFWSAGSDAENAPALLAFVRERYDVLARRLPEETLARMPQWHRGLCSTQHRAQMAQLYGERMKGVSGGGRNLAQALETVDICIRTKEMQAVPR